MLERHVYKRKECQNISVCVYTDMLCLYVCLCVSVDVGEKVREREREGWVGGWNEKKELNIGAREEVEGRKRLEERKGERKRVKEKTDPNKTCYCLQGSRCVFWTPTTDRGKAASPVSLR